jgi:hypothetical protein
MLLSTFIFFNMGILLFRLEKCTRRGIAERIVERTLMSSLGVSARRHRGKHYVNEIQYE